MSVPVRTAIENFLGARCHHPMLTTDIDPKNMEIQVNVFQGDGAPVPGKHNTYTNGLLEWFNFRIPKDAKQNPHHKEWPIGWPLDDHADAIGMTGWDWKNKVSRWVGFDFDAIVGHSDGVGISQRELDEVREAALKLSYVYPITSTSGRGLHLYVRLQPGIATANHSEHAILARAVLAKMSKDAGFDFGATVDCFGGNMWVWSRNQDKEGFRAEKDHCPALLPEPEGWRELLTTPTIPAVDADDDQFTELTQAYQRVPLGAKHHQIIAALGKKATTVWDSDNHLLRTHTCALKQVHITHSLSGEFEDDSPGTDLKTPNCYAFPLPDGGFMVYRFGRDEEPREFNVAKVRVKEPSECGPTPEKEPSASEWLTKIVTTEGEPFHTSGGELYVTVPVGDHRETYPVDSKDFRQWLQYRYYSKRKRTPPKNALTEVVESIEAVARYEGPTYPVHRRYACSNGTAYLDLANGNGEVIEITPDGYKVIQCPDNIKFISSNGQLPLPYPEDGNLEELKDFVSVSDDRAWVLLIAGLLGCLMPGGSYWVVLLQAGHGSGKTTSLRFLRQIIDPSTADVRAMPRDEHSLLLAARAGLMVCLDNASTLQPWQLDAICRLATGAGMGSRKLYSQDDEHLLSAKSPVFVTAIDDVAVRADFLSRCLAVGCGSIDREARLPEAELTAAFEKARPRLLGALCKAVSVGLKKLPTTQPKQLPRMADAYKWICACEPGLGWKPGTFERSYAEAEQTISEAVLQSPVAAALRAMLKKEKEWRGNAKELSQELLKYVDSSMLTDGWPSSPTAMGMAVQRLASNLRDTGIRVEQGRNRTWSFSLN